MGHDIWAVMDGIVQGRYDTCSHIESYHSNYSSMVKLEDERAIWQTEWYSHHRMNDRLELHKLTQFRDKTYVLLNNVWKQASASFSYVLLKFHLL